MAYRQRVARVSVMPLLAVLAQQNRRATHNKADTARLSHQTPRQLDGTL